MIMQFQVKAEFYMLLKAMNKLIKNAQQIQRTIDVNSNNGNIDRRVYSLDDVKLLKYLVKI